MTSSIDLALASLPRSRSRAGAGTGMLATRRSAELEDWLLRKVAEYLQQDVGQLDAGVSLMSYGLDSASAVGIAAELEEWLGVEVPERLLFEERTVRSVAARLSAAHAGIEEEKPVASERPGAVVARDAAPEGPGRPRMLERVAELGEVAARLKAQGNYFYQQPIEAVDGAWVVIGGRRMLMLSSYSYLGLARHPRIAAAAREAMERFGTGSHGSPLLSGTTTLHRRLAERIAAFKRTGDAIVFSSGFVANLATISALVGRDEVVIGDRHNHRSILDGCQMARGRFIAYEHGDMGELESALRRAGQAAKLVVVDAVFSMSGDVVDLPRVVELCRRHGALLMVDEAHSMGVLGETGRGIEEHFGLPPDAIDLKMGTLSKTIPSAGGYVAGSARLIDALAHQASGFIFSGALPPPQVAAAVAAFDVIEDEPHRVRELRRKARRYADGLRAMGLSFLGSTTPIVPILCPDTESCFAMAHACARRGVFVMPAVYPAVPLDAPRLRTTITCAHGEGDIDFILETLEAAGREAGILRRAG